MTLLKAFLWLRERAERAERDQRGDVPGWVMITVMTIIIASSILLLFQARVTSFLSDALDKYM